MKPQLADPAHLGAASLEASQEPAEQSREFERLWRSFMTARATLGLVLLLLQGSIFFLSPPQSSAPLLVCVAYFAAALAVRLMTRPRKLGNVFDAQWLRTVGVDVVAFGTLQLLQSSAINYVPLFAFPVLMASILGSMMLAMGAAAGVTLLLFAYAAWQSIASPWDTSTHFLQAALTGAGCFAISFIASQFASRLATVELRAQRSQLAATVQRQVNELVIASLTDGILVVDDRSTIRSANPAAHLILGVPDHSPDKQVDLTNNLGWRALQNVVTKSFATGVAQQTEVSIEQGNLGQRKLWVRTQLTEPLGIGAQSLCVVFMQDQRELQARMRTEKLASMGRMSAAVAHEIRNPLAAIMQANELLAEGLTAPAQHQLSQMVQQNAQRLEKIVRDILRLTHAPSQRGADDAQLLDLLENIIRVCRDWTNQHAIQDELSVSLPKNAPGVWFETEHLRRILINLLDNAHRYASHQSGSIQVSVDFSRASAPAFEASMQVWSDGAPLEPSVEQHLFEPFFSSESRSSGLGLYICRELCESHGACITYSRSTRMRNNQPVQGNEFSVTFKSSSLAILPTTEPQTD